MGVEWGGRTDGGGGTIHPWVCKDECQAFFHYTVAKNIHSSCFQWPALSTEVPVQVDPAFLIALCCLLCGEAVPRKGIPLGLMK